MVLRRASPGFDPLPGITQGQGDARGAAPGVAALNAGLDLPGLGSELLGSLSLGSGGRGIDIVDGGAAINNRAVTGAGDYVLLYRTQQDSRVRLEHAKLEGLVWELDDPGAPTPPLGYGCRCAVEIVPRISLKKQPETVEAALGGFNRAARKDGGEGLAANIRTYIGGDAADAFSRGDLRLGDLTTATGDPITATQAKAIALARAKGDSPNVPLAAVAQLQGMGISGRNLAALATQASARVAQGESAQAAAAAVIRESPRRGYVRTNRPASVDAAAKAMTRTGLVQAPPPNGPAKPAAPEPTPAPKPAPAINPPSAPYSAPTKSLAAALVKGAAPAIRQAARDLTEAEGIRSSLPGQTKGGVIKLTNKVGRRGAMDIVDGDMEINKDVMAGAKRAAVDIDAGNLPTPADVHDLRTIVHETAHAGSPLAWQYAGQSYKVAYGPVRLVEETTVEILARQTVRRAIGVGRADAVYGARLGLPRSDLDAVTTIRTGQRTYDDLMMANIRAAQQVAPDVDIDAIHDRLEAAALAWRARAPGSVATASNTAQTWAEDLAVHFHGTTPAAWRGAFKSITKVAGW